MDPVTDPNLGESLKGASIAASEVPGELAREFIHEVHGRGESYLLDRGITASIIELKGRNKEEIAKLAELAGHRVGGHYENRELYRRAFDPELSATDPALKSIKQAYSDGIVCDVDSGLYHIDKKEPANLARMASTGAAPKYVLIVWVDKVNW
jgi:hypothetical protein